jgi:hypothetical protein
MGFQISEGLLQLFLSGGILRQRLGLKGRQQFVPDCFELTPPCMLPVSAVMAMTASWSGITTQS